MSHYYSVLIPYLAKGATRWHPTEATGPLSILSRGAFATEAEAHAWADDHLPDYEYDVRRYEVPTMKEDESVRALRARVRTAKARVDAVLKFTMWSEIREELRSVQVDLAVAMAHIGE